MSAAIVSELRKIRSTRLWWILLLIAAATVAVFAGSFAFALAFGSEGLQATDGGPQQLDATTVAITVYTMGVSLGYVFPMVLGALTVTGEFRHRTIDTTLLAEPRRGRVILAKFIAVLPYAVLYGIVSIAVGVGVGVAALGIAGEPTALDDPEVWRALAMGVVSLTTWALVGVGFGSLITNQIVVIVALLAWTQLVEPIVRLALGFLEPLRGVGAYLPGAAGEAMVGASFYSASGAGDLLAPWAGFAVLLGYAAIAAIGGWLVTFRRDIS